MIACPLCSGIIVAKTSSAGDEVYCSNCRCILASASLGFKIADSSASVEPCSEGGLPGFKGPGESARCYTYEPGNDAQEKRAQQKARQSAYMNSKRGFVEHLVTAVTDFTTADAPDHVLGLDAEEEKKIASLLDGEEENLMEGGAGLGTVTTKDGIKTQGPTSPLNAFSSKFHPSTMDDQYFTLEQGNLGRRYFTCCGGDHSSGSCE